MGKFKNLAVISPEKQVLNRQEKPCSTCHLLKPLEAFHPRKDRPDGRAYQCRVCKNEADKLRYIRDRDKEIKKAMKWNKENREQHLQNVKRYQDKPEVKEKRKKYMTKYFQDRRQDKN